MARRLELFAFSQSVLDHAPVGMVITSADDVIIWANRVMDEILGISCAHVVGSSFSPFVHAEHRAVVAEDAVHLLADREILDVREFRWLDGSMASATRVEVLPGTFTAKTDSGEPLLYGEPPRPDVIRQILDITAKRAAEQRSARVLAELTEPNAQKSIADVLSTLSAPAVRTLLVEDSPGDVSLIREAPKSARVANELSVMGDGEAALRCLRNEGRRCEHVASKARNLLRVTPRTAPCSVVFEMQGCVPILPVRNGTDRLSSLIVHLTR